MVCLYVCYEGMTSPVIIVNGTINHVTYIDKILAAALKYGKKLMGNEFTFQQDGAPVHQAQQTKTRCKSNF